MSKAVQCLFVNSVTGTKTAQKDQKVHLNDAASSNEKQMFRGRIS